MASFHHYKSIKTRAIISLVFIVSGIIALFELYNHETNKDLATQDLESLSDRVITRLAENLVLPLWEVDSNWVSSALDTEMKDKQIYGIFVSGEGNVFAGQRRDVNWLPVNANSAEEGDYIIRSKDVLHDSVKIGNVKIYISRVFMQNKLKNEAYKKIIITLVIIILIILFLVMMLDSIIIGPLTRLLKIAKSVSKGEYSNYTEFTQDDEIGLLGKEFNHMQDNVMLRERERDNAVRKSKRNAKELIKAYNTLEEYQEHLESKVDKRTKELERTRDMAMEATKAKSLFLANMSHELRTPMNSIIGFTARVIKKTAGKLESRELKNLRTVERNAQHLLELINSLLDLSKIEAGKMDVHSESVELPILIQEVLNLSQPLIEDKPVKFTTELLTNITLHTDSVKLKQILINLVSNAVKFTHEGSITIKAELVDTQATAVEPQITISITDTGEGMSKEELQYIFEAFRQVDGDLNRKVGGTGLGLAIVSSFIALLGGTVSVESKKKIGTTFKITLPINLYEMKSEAKVYQKTLPTRVHEHGNHTILCIDDEDDVLDLLSEYLTDENFDVVTTNNPKEVMELAKQIKPLAITLDILMPQKDGWSVLNELKTDSETCNIPVIIISFLDNKALGYQLGAFDFMQKPINQERLISSIDRLSSTSIKKVLVVDDDSEARELMKQILDDSNIDCNLAVDGEDALSVLERSANFLPELILLDLMMPGMDGFEMLLKMQKNPSWVNIPVIIVTAKSLEEHEREFLQPRVASILVKEGLTTEKVLEQVGNTMKRLSINTL